MKPIAIGVLLVGIALLCIGLYIAFKPEPVTTQVEHRTYAYSVSPTPNPAQPEKRDMEYPSSKIGNIEISWEQGSGHWDEYGPGRDGHTRRGPAHHWGRAKGYFAYEFNLVDVRDATISTVLSSEVDNTTTANEADASDVVLVVNGTDVGTKRVIPDNLQGATYTWKVSGSLLRKGNNDLRFEVRDGGLANGLCIYAPIKIKFK